MDIVELSQRIESGDFDPGSSPAKVNFYCKTDDYGVFPVPKDAGEYVTSELKNFLYPQTPHNGEWANRSHPGVMDAMSAGWIVPAPVEIYVHSSETSHPIPVTHVSNIMDSYTKKIGSQVPEEVFELNTQWVVDVPAGHSVLALSPSNYDSPDFTVIPQVIDADEFPIPLRVPIIPQDEEFTIEPGTPIIQVIPFNRSVYEADATVGVFDDGDTPARG